VKLKLNRRRIVILAGGAVVVCLILAHGPARDKSAAGLDNAAQRACSDLIEGYPRAVHKPDRLALADKVLASSARSANRLIAERGMQLGNSAGGTDAEWVAGATAFDSACREAGWVAAA
jgi:hypothetical protein